jgi:hypothetical protein
MTKKRRKARKACVRVNKRVVCGTLVKSGKRRKSRKGRRKARRTSKTMVN